jgi:D-glycero-D-manno-heptose 1,7-bisphosphate phosphatase
LASRELNFNMQSCFVIGDKACDIELGRRVGATTFLVLTGYGSEVQRERSAVADYTVGDLAEAAEVILNLLVQQETVASS